MSAIEALPRPAERRSETRVRLDRLLSARIGRHEGRVVDLSPRGARVRHSGSLARGATARLAFDWGGRKFAASGEILASRVVTLGMHEGESATYDTRMRFTVIEAGAQELLERVLQTIASEELRTWVGNMKGFDDEPRTDAVPRVAGFIRCRRVNQSWEKKWTRNPSQPKDGFALPAGTEPADVEALCRAWLEMSDDARVLLQLTAAAVAEEAAG